MGKAPEQGHCLRVSDRLLARGVGTAWVRRGSLSVALGTFEGRFGFIPG